MTKKSFSAFLEGGTAKWPRRYVRYLFGSIAFFYGPKLFLFVMEDSFGIKLPEVKRKELLKHRGVKRFINAGKPFGRWLEVPLPKTKKDANLLLVYVRSAYRVVKPRR